VTVTAAAARSRLWHLAACQSPSGGAPRATAGEPDAAAGPGPGGRPGGIRVQLEAQRSSPATGAASLRFGVDSHMLLRDLLMAIVLLLTRTPRSEPLGVHMGSLLSRYW
jgi:hypothetical protein